MHFMENLAFKTKKQEDLFKKKLCKQICECLILRKCVLICRALLGPAGVAKGVAHLVDLLAFLRSCITHLDVSITKH